MRTNANKPDRAALLAKHERIRTERRKEEAAAAAKLAADMQRARDRGTRFVAMTPIGMAPHMEFDDGNVIRSGVVDLLNAPGHEYDYRVTVLVEWPGVSMTGERPYGNGGPTVTQVDIIRRRGGNALTARGVQADKLADVTQAAIAACTWSTWDARRPIGISGKQAAMLLDQRRRPGRPRLVDHDELEVVARAYREAPSRQTGEYVRRALVKFHNGAAVSPGTARKRIMEAKRVPGLLAD